MLINLSSNAIGIVLAEMPKIPPNLFFSSSKNHLNFPLISASTTSKSKHKNPFKHVSKKAYELYVWRVRAHKSFDTLFTGTQAIMTRSEAYGYLQYLMGLSEEQAHIANFTVEQCKELIDLLDFAS
jgi:zinc-finger-containing domain